MEEAMPEVYGELARVFDLLERHYRDMQDIEFTVERKKLWMLQTRSGKRTTQAALKIAVDMASEGLITREQGDPARRSLGARPVAPPDARSQGAARRADQGAAGLAGRGIGAVVFDADTAEKQAAAGGRGDPRAGRDQPRGYPRDARRAGHPHRARGA
ncbi:MAG: PEP/pyruvate-binding domain-containing protein [Sphingomonas sp.]